MPNDLNRVILIVRLTREPELRYTPAGVPVASVSAANNRVYGSGENKKETVSYFDLVFWNKSGEIITEYGKKGMQIAIEGKLSQRRWEDQDGNKRSKIEIVVETFQFLGGKKDNDSSGEPSSAPAGASGAVRNGFNGEDVPQCEDNPFSDDMIPF